MKAHQRIGSTPPKRGLIALLFGGCLLTVGAFLALAALVDLFGGADDLAGPVGGGLVGVLLLVGGLFLIRPRRSSPSAELEAARDMHDRLVAAMPNQSSKSQALNRASRLMLDGQYQAAIEAWNSVIRDYPDEKANALSQIGVGHHFLGDFEEAIRWYQHAQKEGYDANMTADNIKDAQDEMAKRSR